jgi:hypothetical protein
VIAQISDDHLDPNACEVLEVWRSINENLVGAEGYPTQNGLASVIGVRRREQIELYVHYWLSESKVGLLYREDEPITPANYATLRDHAVGELEAMGFIVDNAQYRTLDTAARERVLAAMPVFGGGAAAAPESAVLVDDENEIEDVEAVTAFAIEDDDPETILVLDESSAVSVPSVSSNDPRRPQGSRTFPELDPDSWKVFFRMIASL